jgi:hypothetical protein
MGQSSTHRTGVAVRLWQLWITGVGEEVAFDVSSFGNDAEES